MIINEVNEAAEFNEMKLVLKKVITGTEINTRGALKNVYCVFITVTLFACKITFFIGNAFLRYNASSGKNVNNEVEHFVFKTE